ncbi:hypothetical protein J4734_11255 [Klebsiella pneumoniae]|uniref:Uncharacterized protein n=1 Tax=Klebsiella pneumoniae TaxID=573 RepID=A0A939NNY5_KLEPN|nr:hypothetical protein [Klebsiella pneumoniae]
MPPLKKQSRCTGVRADSVQPARAAPAARHGLTPYRGRQRSGTLFAACRSAPFYLARQYV